MDNNQSFTDDFPPSVCVRLCWSENPTSLPNPMGVPRVRISFFDTDFYWFCCCFGSEQVQTCGEIPTLTKMFGRFMYPDSPQAEKHRAKVINSFLERHGFEDVNSPRSLDESLQRKIMAVKMFLVPQRVSSFILLYYTWVKRNAINQPWPWEREREPWPWFTYCLCT